MFNHGIESGRELLDGLGFAGDIDQTHMLSRDTCFLSSAQGILQERLASEERSCDRRHQLMRQLCNRI